MQKTQKLLLVFFALISGSTILTIAQSCPPVVRNSNHSGYINYDTYHLRDCTWNLSRAERNYHALALRISGVSLSSPGYCTGYVMIPGIRRFCKPPVSCMILLSFGDLDPEKLKESMNSSELDCKEEMWITFNAVPTQIKFDAWHRYRKRFRIDYEYINFKEDPLEVTTLPNDKDQLFQTAKQTEAPTIQVAVFAAVTATLIVLLILCGLAIVWMHRRHEKMELTSNALRGSIRAVTRLHENTIQQREGIPSQDNPNEAYAEIGTNPTRPTLNISSQQPHSSDVEYANQGSLSQSIDYMNSPLSPSTNHQQQSQQENGSRDEYATINKQPRM